MTSAVRLASPASDADVAALAGLRFQWCHDEGQESGDLVTFAPAFAAWWRDHATSHLAFLAEIDGEPVGMAWLGILVRIPGPEHFRRRSGMIQSVYVQPAVRGRGIGAALVDAAITAAREHGLAYLGVHPSALSYPVYERAGFAQTSGGLELGLSGPRPSRPE
jgi:GNAT superfamily N-acetyltransferase